MKYYVIDEALAQSIIDYLVKCPFKDVFKMVQGLQQMNVLTTTGEKSNGTGRTPENR